MDWLREICQHFVEYVFGGGTFNSAKNVLMMNPSTKNYFVMDGIVIDFSDLWDAIHLIYENVCVPIAMGLVLIYFVINLIEKGLQQQTLDLEHTVKTLMKLVVAIYFIEHGFELMSTIYSLGMTFVSDVLSEWSASGSPDTSAAAEGAWKAITGEEWDGDWGLTDIGKAIPVLLVSFLAWLIFWVMNIIVLAIVYMRLIEFYIRTAAAPIALSDFFIEGTHSNGWRYIKSYIAVALQGGIIMLILVIYGGLCGAIAPDYSGFIDKVMTIPKLLLYLVEVIALGVAAIGLMLKSLSLTKEIMGSN